MITSARTALDICTYVLGDDAVGAEIAAALAERARSGVRVRLLVDSIGSLKSAHSHDGLLKAAGVHTRLFVPALGLPGRGRTNLRNHRKVVVADGQRLWAGGRNMASEYFVDTGGQPAGRGRWPGRGGPEQRAGQRRQDSIISLKTCPDHGFRVCSLGVFFNK